MMRDMHSNRTNLLEFCERTGFHDHIAGPGRWSEVIADGELVDGGRLTLRGHLDGYAIKFRTDGPEGEPTDLVSITVYMNGRTKGTEFHRVFLRLASDTVYGCEPEPYAEEVGDEEDAWPTAPNPTVLREFYGAVPDPEGGML